MNIFDMFNIEHNCSQYINENSTWTDISHYLMFLTLKNGGCSKSSSGAIKIYFPTHWDEDMEISVEIGGYDMPNMSRHEEFSAKTETELKKQIITKLEQARNMIINGSDDEEL